jgi:hypothetical protein
MEKIMSYSPRTLSYNDGLDDGARRERRRILDLLFSEPYYGYHDMHDAQVLHKFTELVEEIEAPNNEN